MTSDPEQPIQSYSANIVSFETIIELDFSWCKSIFLQFILNYIGYDGDFLGKIFTVIGFK
ncbi:MAG: hypothetical protein CMI12_04035 [Oceanospirillum sp.]|nr:hypothetical protein [Oceanospirillum sp.]